MINFSPTHGPVFMKQTYQKFKVVASGGSASIALSIVITNILRIFSSMALTRLLDASAYGIVGLLMVITVAFAMISDIGVFPFVIRHKDRDDPSFLNEVWTLRLIRSALLTIAMVVFAVPLAKIMARPDMALVIAVYGVSFLIDGLTSLAFATAVREGALWRLSFLDLSAVIVQIIVSIVLAILLHSYWAIVWAMLAGSIGKGILSYSLFPGSRRSFNLSRARAAELWQFTKFIAPSSVLALVISQGDKLFLGRMLPLDQFGIYVVAATLAVTISTPPAMYATRVLYPRYSDAAREDQATLANIFYSTRRKVEILYMLAVGGVIGSSNLIVEILYDDRYRPVAAILSVLAISSAMRFTNLAADQAFMALGRVEFNLHANIMRMFWLAGGGAITLIWLGPKAFIWTIGLMEVACLPVYWLRLRAERILDIRQELIGMLPCLAGVGLGLATSAIGLTLLN